MTQNAVPRWFPADDIFRGHGGWFIGSPVAFSLGPYRDEEDARAASAEIRARLGHAKTRGEVVRIVRAYLEATASPQGVEQPEPEVPARAGERPRLWYRSDRFFSVDSRWYFTTREGIEVGPYESRQVAEQDSVRLLHLLQGEDREEARILAIRQFMLRPVICGRVH